MPGQDEVMSEQAGFIAAMSDDNGELRITVPVHRNWPLFILITFWLVVWILGGLFALLALLAMVPLLVVGGGLSPKAGFLLAWLVGWAVGLLLAGYEWMRVAGGREILSVSPDVLVTKRVASRFARVREFDLSEVRNLRVFPSDWTLPRFLTYASGHKYWFWAGGRIAFDHGSRTHRIGTELSEAEAKHLVSLLLQRFPSLASQELS